MNLDDLSSLSALDSQQLLAALESLPERLQASWQAGLQQPLPGWAAPQYVLLAGVEGAASAAELLAAYAAPLCRLPIVVHQNDEQPAWAAGPHTLVIAASPTGNDPEVIAAYQTALQHNCACLAISAGGQLAALAQAARQPFSLLPAHSPAEADAAAFFGHLLAIFFRLGLLPDPSAELASAITSLENQRSALLPGIPASRNPAKRMAGQLVGRNAAIFGAGLLAPVARHWKNQINRCAKAWAQADTFPSAGHTALGATLQPETPLAALMVIFLRSPDESCRSALRGELTRQAYMVEGLNTDFVDAAGPGPLAQQWTCLQIGEYIAIYLALAYGLDPAPSEILAALKQEINRLE